MQLNLNLQSEIEIPLILLNNDKKPIELDFLPDDYAVIDIETTGLNPVYDSIIEISGLKINNNQVVAEFSSLVKPTKRISPFISNLTGITNEDVENSDDIKKVLFNFCNFIENDILIGHNVKFDLSFINNKLVSCFGGSLKNDFADTLSFARKKYEGLSSYKLTNIAHHLNIDTKNAHRALNDCYMTYKIVCDLKKN